MYVDKLFNWTWITLEFVDLQQMFYLMDSIKGANEKPCQTNSKNYKFIVSLGINNYQFNKSLLLHVAFILSLIPNI